jgi:hypothetical protein
VAIGPAWLQRVPAYKIETHELETRIRIGYMRPRDVTEHVGLATASCTRTGTPQRLESKKRFQAVVPRDGKLVSYLLNVCWFKPH